MSETPLPGRSIELGTQYTGRRGGLACWSLPSISAERSPISSGFDEADGRLRPGQEPDHARPSGPGRHRLPAQERAQIGRHRRAHPRLDHRHQHADRAQGRHDRPDRHPRHPRRLHHRPRQPAGSLQSLLPPASPAGVAPTRPSRSRSACSPRATVHEPLGAPASRRPAAFWPMRASKRSRSASCIPTPIPSTSARPARSSAPCCRTPMSRCRTRSCASTASSSAPRPRW